LLQKSTNATPLDRGLPVTCAGVKILVLMLALMLGAPSAFAQQRDARGVPGKNQGMSRDERQRMRNDMQDVYRDRGDRARQERPPQRQLSPQEREQLRRDIQDANRTLKR
jgi:hypothetical protein